MANIRLDMLDTIQDGQTVTFKAPCDCTAINGIKVYYPGTDGNATSKEFLLKDTHGNDVSNINDLFKKNTYISALLDVPNGFAYLINAATNAYLEQKIKNIVFATEEPTEVAENTIVLVYED